MKLTYHPKAKADLEEITRYYAAIEISLAKDFKDRLDMAVQSILTQPLRYRIIEANIHKCLMTRFPYAVYFSSCWEIDQHTRYQTS